MGLSGIPVRYGTGGGNLKNICGTTRPQNLLRYFGQLGSPTGGTYDLTLRIDGISKTRTFAYNATNGDVEAAFISAFSILDEFTFNVGQVPADVFMHDITGLLFTYTLDPVRKIMPPLIDWSQLVGDQIVGFRTEIERPGYE